VKPPWHPGLGAADDSESLQTDVMRFIAILGLCLTAIFSLVNAARVEHAPDVVATEKKIERPIEPSPGIVPERPAQAASAVDREVEPRPFNSTDVPEPEPELVPETALEPEQRGFTLAFASESVLVSMLVAGSVRVYAISGEIFWQLYRGGEPRRGEPPASYYEMDALTIPSEMRSRARGLPQPLKWGVTLPPGAPEAINRLMQEHGGGELVIGANGTVTLDQG